MSPTGYSARVSPDRRLHRSEPTDVGAGGGRAAAEARRSTKHAGDRDRNRTAAVKRVVTTKAALTPSWSLNAGRMFAAEIGRLVGVNVPLIPMAHEYLMHDPSGLPARHADHARPVAARVLPSGIGRPDHGRYERDPRRGDSMASTGLQRQAPRARLGPGSNADDERHRPHPHIEGRDVVRLVNGPEAFTPDGESSPAPPRCRLRWRRVRAHAPAGAAAMAGWSPNDRRRPPPPRRQGEDSRRFGRHFTISREYTLARPARSNSTYYDVKYPAPRTKAPAGRCGSHRLREARGAGRKIPARSPAGRGQLVEPIREGRRVAATGAAGPAASGRPRSRTSIRSCPNAALFDFTSYAKIEVGVAGGGIPGTPHRQSRRACGRRAYLHADAQRWGRHRVRLHCDPIGRGQVSHRHRHRIRAATTSTGSATTCPRTAPCRRGHAPRAGVHRVVGTGGERSCSL